STWDAHVGCPGGATSGGAALPEVTLAGTRVAWVESVAGNNRDLVLWTATPGRKPVQAAFAENGMGASEQPDGDYLGNVFGHGSLLVYDTWRVCAVIPPGVEDDVAIPCPQQPAPPPATEAHVPTRETLWRLGARPVALRMKPDVLRVVGVDGGRIATLQPSG